MSTGREPMRVSDADLDQLFTDLPASAAAPSVPVVVAPAQPSVARAVPAARAGFAGLPPALKILWTIWAGTVLIRLTVWLLVSLDNGPEYFWPMWLAVPGVALTAVTAAVAAARSHP